MKELDSTEIKAVVRARHEGRFFATPQRPSPVAYFQIGYAFPRLAGKLATVRVEDLIVGVDSVWVGPFVEAELFSELATPVHLTLPLVTCDSRIELVLFNESEAPASLFVRFFWARPQR